jgi:hypothetical protein
VLTQIYIPGGNAFPFIAAGLYKVWTGLVLHKLLTLLRRGFLLQLSHFTSQTICTSHIQVALSKATLPDIQGPYLKALYP